METWLIQGAALELEKALSCDPEIDPYNECKYKDKDGFIEWLKDINDRFGRPLCHATTSISWPNGQTVAAE